MKNPALAIVLLCAAAPLTDGATFYTPVSITSSNSVAFFPIERLYEGPGVGYSASAPHNAIIGDHTWVTDAPGGFPSDYVMVAGAPILVIDLGADLFLTEISTWGYTVSNANGVKTFDLRFATAAEGTGGFSTSIPNQAGFSAALDDVARDSHPLVPVTARYVEFTATSNYFSNGGNGPPPGGDRVGLGEIAFAVVPEPAAGLLGLAACIGLIGRRGRRD